MLTGAAPGPHAPEELLVARLLLAPPLWRGELHKRTRWEPSSVQSGSGTTAEPAPRLAKGLSGVACPMSQQWCKGMFKARTRAQQRVRFGQCACMPDGAMHPTARDGHGPILERAAARDRLPPGRSLTELRWHLFLPTDGASACENSRRIWEQVQGALPEHRCQSFAGASEVADEHAWDPYLHGAYREERHLDLRTGIRVRYFEWGRGRRPTVVLLHGLGEVAERWERAASGLCNRGYRVLAPDLRGHGGSSAPSAGGGARARYSLRLMAEDLLAWVLELDLYARPFALVGHGLGAAVALRFAAAYPQLVGVLGLVELAAEPGAGADYLRYHYAQAARFEDQRQAVLLFQGPHLGWPLRDRGDVMYFCAQVPPASSSPLAD
eukprot:scaffold266_cov391-Prasinococcus_capsulatus_cf.AAC.40